VDSFSSVCGLPRVVLRDARCCAVVLDRAAGCAYNAGARKRGLCGVRRAASVLTGQRRRNVAPIEFRGAWWAIGFSLESRRKLDWGDILLGLEIRLGRN